MLLLPIPLPMLIPSIHHNLLSILHILLCCLPIMIPPTAVGHDTIRRHVRRRARELRRVRRRVGVPLRHRDLVLLDEGVAVAVWVWLLHLLLLWWLVLLRVLLWLLRMRILLLWWIL